ncbi:Poly (ADP-ribose) polymerase [Fasciolopsis buskii]|uniref:NAD(+) ADP-ribosyltransferase n=1 Tax=Fasciolopsis buskii TaxID=27845 RepID=A0A8E0S6Z3_9TREM|nr:Poly (ADP-ribose) polymerase [Fasciolopsis buski]
MFPTHPQVSQEALKAQSKLVWNLRDKLEREVSKDALIGLLEYNEQFIPTGLSNLLDAVADAMLFGALTTCPSCKEKPLHYSNGQYKCGGMVNSWTPCLFTTREPKRLAFKVPKEYHDVEFL